ncbi:MAG: hypothetical protein DI556_02710 [Rhodovulum sulfidophilum]|uniref:Peptidase inhibitor I78 family protein n=1 Tax=Rhodovulum sulfidophilum TaxID=35806 RepID=A0A2W5NGE1_RHOSU|nr:MAG: hypothetical protein DI556_02710 [Rhodovulum sulfidophilum]
MPRWIAATCLGLTGLLALSACDTGPGKDIYDFAGTLGQDSCGAVSNQNLVGKTVAELNVVDLPRNTRVIQPGATPGTSRDERRMTVIIGGDKVTRVYCG